MQRKGNLNVYESVYQTYQGHMTATASMQALLCRASHGRAAAYMRPVSPVCICALVARLSLGFRVRV